MANKPINQLDNASSLDATDLLVLWDSSTNTAQNMTGQQFTTWLTALAAGKGGISSITKTGTAGLVDTYTITYADASASTFTVTNGAKGDQGEQTYVWIAYAATEPDSDSDMSLIPAPWMGIYVGLESTQGNLHYTDYTWYEIQGPKGDGVAYTAKTGEAGLTSTYTMYTADGTAVGTFSVTNGEGGVSTVNNIAPDGNGNVPAIVTDVTVLGLTSGSATIAQAYSALQVSQMLFATASDFAVGELPLSGGSRITYGTIEIIKATSNGSRGRINFYGKENTNRDWRMYLSSGNVPTGVWIPVEGEVLWTNPNPTSDFGAQTISVDTSPYRFVMIAFLASAAEQYNVSTITAKNTWGRAESMLNMTWGSTTITAGAQRGYLVHNNNSEVYFEDCLVRGTISSATAPTPLNTCLIPQYIVGIP